MKAVLDVAVPLVTAFLMMIVGLDLSRADLSRVTSRRRVVLAGLLGPLVFLPPIALLVLSVVPMPAEVGAGLLIVAFRARTTRLHGEHARQEGRSR